MAHMDKDAKTETNAAPSSKPARSIYNSDETRILMEAFAIACASLQEYGVEFNRLGIAKILLAIACEEPLERDALARATVLRFLDKR